MHLRTPKASIQVSMFGRSTADCAAAVSEQAASATINRVAVAALLIVASPSYIFFSLF
jgi:hypothetical protein